MQLCFCLVLSDSEVFEARCQNTIGSRMVYLPLAQRGECTGGTLDWYAGSIPIPADYGCIWGSVSQTFL